MWHENKEEMMEFLKSILRLDEDQCARRVAQKYLKVVDPDYYEFESKCRPNSQGPLRPAEPTKASFRFSR